MKRFARALVVTLALVILASVIAFVPQKSAVAANGEMVTIVIVYGSWRKISD